MKPMSVRIVKSADRTLDLIEYLAATPEEPTFADISANLHIPKSSLFHLLGNLIARRYVEQSEKGRYRLGPRLGELAGATPVRFSLEALLLPILRELSEELNETCGLNAQVGDQLEVIATHAGRQALGYTMKLSEFAPLYAVSGGKILLAHKDAQWLRGYLDRVRFERFTPRTIQSTDRLIQEIEQARMEGFAYSHEEFTPGIVGIGTAVAVEGNVIAALNVALPTARYNDSFAARIRRRLGAAARQAESIIAPHHGSGLLHEDARST